MTFRESLRDLAVRQRGALRGVRLVAYDSVCAYIRRAAQVTAAPVQSSLSFATE